MQLSEWIKSLQTILDEHGDMPVAVESFDGFDVSFYPPKANVEGRVLTRCEIVSLTNHLI